MFDIGWSEMAIIMLLALIIIGPKDLPRVARTIGQWVRKGRTLAREFQTSLEDMARETELDEVKKEIEKVGRTDFKTSIENTVDPKGELGKAFDTSIDEKPDAASKKALSGRTENTDSSPETKGSANGTKGSANGKAGDPATATSSTAKAAPKAGAEITASTTSETATTADRETGLTPKTGLTKAKTARKATRTGAAKKKTTASKRSAAKKPVSSTKRSAKPTTSAQKRRVKRTAKPSAGDEGSSGDQTAMAAKPS